ncbi:MAG: YbhB/YbcL family Raf kinase inhibitor-like protein [Terracidiphilus sp.]
MHVCEPIAPAANTNSRSRFLLQIFLLLVLLLMAPFVGGCRSTDPQPSTEAGIAGSSTLTLSSASLRDGKFPSEFTCDGADNSPPLGWTEPSAAAKSLVLTVTDPDAPSGTFTHWVLYNLPANSNGLPINVPKQDQLSDGSRQGRNDFGKIGYGGPCGPHGSTHRYFFDLFALDTKLDLPAGATRAQVEDAINIHVLARGKLMARYSR